MKVPNLNRLISLGVYGTILYLGLFETLREFDTTALTDGASYALACLKQGKFFACSTSTGNVQHFPLFQYLLSFPLLELGASVPRAARILGYLSVFYFLGLISVFQRELQSRGKAIAELALFILMTSPFLRYSQSSFGEMGAALMTLLFVVQCSKEPPRYRPGLVTLLFILAGITKEIAFPFLFLLGWIVQPRWKNLIPLALGALGSFLLNSAFNFFRFGTVANLSNLNPLNFVPDFSTQVNFAAALWFSPSGGILFFWPSFFLLLVISGWTMISIPFKKRVPLPRSLPFLGMIVSLAGLTAGFSKWFAPFGWVAWGPRLILPWIPAMIFIFFSHYSQAIESWLKKAMSSKICFWAITNILLAVSLPQFMVLLLPDMVGELFKNFPLCTADAIHDLNPPQYYLCIKSIMWNTRWTLFKIYSPSFSLKYLPFALGYTFYLLNLIHSMRRGNLTDSPSSPTLLGNSN